MITTLCIGSGGIRGLSMISALKYLYEQNYIDFEKIKTYSCVSVGSIIGILLLVGYSINDIYNIEYDFDLLSPNFSLDLLFEKYGFDNGDNIIEFFNKIILKKINNINITFLDLYNLTKKEFLIVTTNYTQNCEKIFNYKETPNVPVMLAIRMSISIPIIYTPILYENNYYIDGAIINKVYIPKNSNPENTLAIYLDNYKPPTEMTLQNIIVGLIFIMSDQMLKCDTNNYNCLLIDSPNTIGCFDYSSMTKEKKNVLFSIGEMTAKKYLIKELKKNINNKKTNIIKNVLNDIIIKIENITYNK